jgi:ketosteroid isomerase-like protein
MITGYREQGGIRMADVDGVDELIERYDLALGEFYNGNPKPVQSLWSHRDDVTLAPPFGAPTHGWEEVAESMERGASNFADGETTGFEILEKYVTDQLGHILRIERAKARVGGGEEAAPFVLRVTMVFRPEGGEWKVMHRHADPITERRPAESVIQE